MNPRRVSPLHIALLMWGFSFGFAPVRADNLPEVTNTIESLTPEQARRLVAEFEGDELPLNGLKTLDAKTAEALAGFKGQALFLDGLKTLDATTAVTLAEFNGQSLRLNGLTTLDAETAEALGRFNGAGLYLGVLPTLDSVTAKALASNDKWDGRLSALIALDSPDSIAIAQALAARKGRLALPSLKKISPKTLSALIAKEDVEIPLIEALELIPEPDGSATEDFVIPEWLEERQKQQQAAQAAE